MTARQRHLGQAAPPSPCEPSGASSRPSALLDGLFDWRAALALAASLVILTCTGVIIGEAAGLVACLLGAMLCLVGLSMRSAAADRWVLLPWLAFCALALASCWSAYGDLASGYVLWMLLFPVAYLLVGCANPRQRQALKRACCLWAVLCAGVGIIQFAWQVVAGGAVLRLSSLLGSPNAAGIFFVVGWLCLQGEQRDGVLAEGSQRLRRVLAHGEPLLLGALALTLSVGSLLALLVGAGVLVAACSRQHGARAGGLMALSFGARWALGGGAGLLAYAAASHGSAPGLSLLAIGYMALSALAWPSLRRLLEGSRVVSIGLSMGCVLVAAALVAFRPSAASTASERIAMMGSGLSYAGQAPWIGVGPLRWRALDLADGGLYFNTWHIHDLPIHVAAELGLPALLMLAVVVARAFAKLREPAALAILAAFCAHCLVDTSFAFPGVGMLVLLAAAPLSPQGDALRPWEHRAVFGACGLLFALVALIYAGAVA